MKHRIMRSVLSEGQIHQEIIDTPYGKKLLSINASNYVTFEGRDGKGSEPFIVPRSSKKYFGTVYVELKGNTWIARANNIYDNNYVPLTPAAQKNIERYFATTAMQLIDSRSKETREADIWQVEMSINSVKSERDRLAKQLEDVDRRLAELNRKLVTLKR